MEAQILERLTALTETGRKLLGQRGSDGDHPQYWVGDHLIPEAQAWITSVASLATLLAPPGSYFLDEVKRITSNENLKAGVPWSSVQKVLGLLLSLNEEARQGLLRKIEYAVFATAFDDFLDHAEAFHKGNMAREAGVLAAIVLEDTIKRIAAKNNILSAGLSLEQLVDALVNAQVFTLVKAKRVKAYAGVRNPALHAEWDKFDIRDAGELIAGTRELIEHFL